MNDNGWFVTMLIYLGMVRAALIDRPTATIATTARSHPKASSALVLLAVGIFCGHHAFAARNDAPLYTWLGISAVMAALIVLIVVHKATKPEHNYVDRSPVERGDWFREF